MYKGLQVAPLAGIALFFVLYIAAAYMYPGGTKYDKTTKGFSMRHNYWCDLMDRTAYNGELNPGSSIAIAATVLMCGCIGLLCYFFPLVLGVPSPLSWVIPTSGIASMVVFVFLFTQWHNQVILVASPLAGIALFTILIALFNLQEWTLLYFAVYCFLLSLANFVIYQTNWMLIILPALQKILFVSIAIWAAMLNVLILKRA
jgi:hypothetical protein